MQFQFHKGSINIIQGQGMGRRLGRFNSIKVRLIFISSTICCDELSGFNSIKVRLICPVMLGVFAHCPVSIP